MYERYRARVFAYAVSKVGRELAEEITSDVFLIAWQRIAELPEQPLPWLLVTTRNVASNQFRAATRQRAVAAELGTWIAVERESGDLADDVTERAALLTALGMLPEPDRDMLTLVAWHNLPAKSVASVIGCSTATYFVRLHRARRRLEQALAEVNREPAPSRRQAAADEPRSLTHQAGTRDQDRLPPGAGQRREPTDRMATGLRQERFR